MITYPQTILDLFGAQGKAWLDALPSAIADLEQRWHFTAHAPSPDLSYNFVASAPRQDGTPVVLKMGVPNELLNAEIAVLRRYSGQGMVRPLEADPSLAAMLLERLEPGTPLGRMTDDDQATRIAAGVMVNLRLPLEDSHPFPTIDKIASGLSRLRKTFEGGCGPFPEHLITRAEGLFADLLASQGPPVLLHGDLHHWNILQNGEEWYAIDPQGFAGEAEYEIGALMRNPIPMIFDWPDLAKRQARRLDILCEMLSFDRQRLVGWAFAQEVLSAWWAYEDHGLVENEWAIARSLENL